jgi:hypothetical protein
MLQRYRFRRLDTMTLAVKKAGFLTSMMGSKKEPDRTGHSQTESGRNAYSNGRLLSGGQRAER